jgi:hypothetical protein
VIYEDIVELLNVETENVVEVVEVVQVLCH